MGRFFSEKVRKRLVYFGLFSHTNSWGFDFFQKKFFSDVRSEIRLVQRNIASIQAWKLFENWLPVPSLGFLNIGCLLKYPFTIPDRKSFSVTGFLTRVYDIYRNVPYSNILLAAVGSSMIWHKLSSMLHSYIPESHLESCQTSVM